MARGCRRLHDPSMTTAALPEALDAELSAALGEEGWRTDAATRRAHAEDDSRQSAIPGAEALPRGRGQVAAVGGACRTHLRAVVAARPGPRPAAAAAPF